MPTKRRSLLGAAAVTALAAGLLGSAPAQAHDQHNRDKLSRQDTRTLKQYTSDTWASLAAMVDTATGLPHDNIGADLSPGSRSGTTSPTNIGTYLWSAVSARDTGLIKNRDLVQRARQTLATLDRMPYNKATGMYYNWFDPHTGETLHIWPENGNVVVPFQSSVDNGWLAASLMVLRNAVPEVKDQANTILNRMRFDSYYAPDAKPGSVAGLMRGGLWETKPEECSLETTYKGRKFFTTCHAYGALGETRIATYVGVALGQVPSGAYFAAYRAMPDAGCDWAWQQQKPVGHWEEHEGVNVFEGTYSYAGHTFVPTWGGSMFEALMVPLVVPESEWGKESWGRSHPQYVDAQIEHGLADAKYGYWGFSPSNNPAGGYREYGVDAMGIGDGYTTDQQRTLMASSYPGCRPDRPAPAKYGDGVVTPHASFLALSVRPKAAMENLAKLKKNFDAYGKGGFYDAVDVGSGQVSKRYLALDQGMAMAAAVNLLEGDNLPGYFSDKQTQKTLKPLLAREEWNIPENGR